MADKIGTCDKCANDDYEGDVELQAACDPWGYVHAYYCEECMLRFQEPRDDGECFRGGEAAAYSAERQAAVQRDFK